MKKLTFILLMLFIAVGGFAESETDFAFDNGASLSVRDGSLMFIDSDGNSTDLGKDSIAETYEDRVVVRREKKDGLAYRIITEYGATGEVFYDMWGFDENRLTIARGDGGFGIINLNGEWALDAVYADVTRNTSDEIAGFEKAPYFASDADGSVTVLAFDDLRIIGTYENTDKYLTPTYINPAVFSLETWSRIDYCSMESGETLFSVEVSEGAHDFSGVIYNDTLAIDGSYRYYIEGTPERMTACTGDAPDTVMWLITNSGEKVSGDYQLLTPLVWNGEGGVYKFAVYDPADYTPVDGFGGEYDPAEWYGKSYREGLINQDGEVLAEAEYIKIEALSPTQFALTDVNGEVSILEQ